MKVLIKSVIRSKGVSTKNNPNGVDYDICTLTYLVPFEERSSSNENTKSYNKLTGFGMQDVEMEIDPEAISQFSSLKFPAFAEIKVDIKPRYGRSTNICTGLVKAA